MADGYRDNDNFQRSGLVYEDKDGVLQTAYSDRPFPFIATTHLRVHEQRMFYGSHIIPHGSELINDAALDILISVGDKAAHIIFSTFFGGDHEVRHYEGVTTSSDGVSMPVFCKARFGTPPSTLTTMFHVPVITDLGLELPPVFVPGGRGPNAPGGGGTDFNLETILRPNTKYVFRLINRSGASHMGSLGTEFYEL